MNVSRSVLPALLALALAGFATAAEKKPEAAALAVLASNAGLQEKARACQELSVYGGSASVAPLAALLDQEHLADYARSGLENIKDPAAGAALRQALPKLNGRFVAGAVNSLGVRREAKAVGDLQKLALDPQRGVAAEALASLGMIANADAAKALKKVLSDGPADLRTAAGHAAITAAEQFVKDGNKKAARELLDLVAKKLPAGHIADTAKRQAAAL